MSSQEFEFRQALFGRCRVLVQKNKYRDLEKMIASGELQVLHCIPYLTDFSCTKH